MKPEFIDIDKLPCPRFEFRWERINGMWNECHCVYSLVIPLRAGDIRRGKMGDARTEYTVPLGTTKVGLGRNMPPITDGVVDTPFRDFSHAQYDNKALGGHIPIVAVCDEIANLVKVTEGTD